MADTLYFARDTIVDVNPTGTTDYFRIPVMDGYSFSQATNSTEITLSEAADSSGNSRRARQMFNDSYAPAEWSLQTYVRPFLSSGSGTGNRSAATQFAVEDVFWDAFVSSTVGGGLTSDATDLNIDFTNSNKTVVGTFDMYIELGAGKANPTVYKLSECVVDSISIDFDIEGIAMLAISGFGSIIEDNAGVMPGDQGGNTLIVEGGRANDTGNFIRQKLSSLAMTASDSTTFPGASSNGVYNAVLTGGNITFSNNISYLTPDTLGVVNQPIGHITGARSVSGSFTAYLNNETGSTADLFEDLIEATSVITNSFDLTFSVGGSSSSTRVDIQLPTAHLQIPTHSIDDVISIEATFDALPTTISGTNEASITYFGQAVTSS